MKTTRIELRLTAEQKEQIKALAKENKMNVSQYILSKCTK